MTSTITVTAPTSTTTFTQTSSASLVIFPYQGVTIALPYTNSGPITTTALRSTTETDYIGTSTVTTTLTQPASTLTVYQACATNNYADHTIYNGTLKQIEYIAPKDGVYGKGLDASTPYECCSKAIEIGAATWTYEQFEGNDAFGDCGYYATNSTSQAGNEYQAAGESTNYTIVHGNGYYGEVSQLLDLGF